VEVGTHPAFQVDGFAHINYLALRVFVQVHARFVGQIFEDLLDFVRWHGADILPQVGLQ